MTQRVFNSLDLNQRLYLIVNSGEFISEIVYYGYRIRLYIVNSLYVEVFRNVHSNDIELVEVLEPEEGRLQLYAKDIDISELLEN
ncbi:MAG: hypothetical protein V4565_05090 [Bacteroidota bacterium]